jgi:trimeric autotransporter adhesin
MKINLTLILVSVMLIALSASTRAQCPQVCDGSAGNTALGNNALPGGAGNFDTAVGDSALSNNAIGIANTASGFHALFNNTTGNNNTASGVYGLNANTTGYQNTASGYLALYNNTIGYFNTANGAGALLSNTTGIGNTASGVSALSKNTVGSNNTASGLNALMGNTGGDNNIAIGVSAGINLTTGSDNIDIGNAGVASESRHIRIGTKGTQAKTFIAGIAGVPVAGGVGVIIGNSGQLGTVVSSERFKDAIKPMDKASEAILALQPVTFRYKHELDPDGIPQFGLVAEQVEKVDRDLVARDDQGKPYTVRYEAVNAMLLNEFLKEHRKVEEQQAAIKQLESRVAQCGDLRSTVAQQEKQIQFLTASVKEQASQFQKVSAELQVRKSSPPIVLNNR